MSDGPTPEVPNGESGHNEHSSTPAPDRTQKSVNPWKSANLRRRPDQTRPLREWADKKRSELTNDPARRARHERLTEYMDSWDQRFSFKMPDGETDMSTEEKVAVLRVALDEARALLDANDPKKAAVGEHTDDAAYERGLWLLVRVYGEYGDVRMDMDAQDLFREEEIKQLEELYKKDSDPENPQ